MGPHRLDGRRQRRRRRRAGRAGRGPGRGRALLGRGGRGGALLGRGGRGGALLGWGGGGGALLGRGRGRLLGRGRGGRLLLPRRRRLLGGGCGAQRHTHQACNLGLARCWQPRRAPLVVASTAALSRRRPGRKGLGGGGGVRHTGAAGTRVSAWAGWGPTCGGRRVARRHRLSLVDVWVGDVGPNARGTQVGVGVGVADGASVTVRKAKELACARGPQQRRGGRVGRRTGPARVNTRPNAAPRALTGAAGKVELAVGPVVGEGLVGAANVCAPRSGEGRRVSSSFNTHAQTLWTTAALVPLHHSLSRPF